MRTEPSPGKTRFRPWTPRQDDARPAKEGSGGRRPAYKWRWLARAGADDLALERAADTPVASIRLVRVEVEAVRPDHLTAAESGSLRLADRPAEAALHPALRVAGLARLEDRLAVRPRVGDPRNRPDRDGSLALPQEVALVDAAAGPVAVLEGGDQVADDEGPVEQLAGSESQGAFVATRNSRK